MILNISLTAMAFREKEVSGTAHTATQRHISEDLNPLFHRCYKPKSCNIFFFKENFSKCHVKGKLMQQFSFNTRAAALQNLNSGTYAHQFCEVRTHHPSYISI